MSITHPDQPVLSVITGAWDDIPALFYRLGLPFENLGQSLTVFEDPHCLENTRALYIACGAEYEVSKQSAENIRHFVERGGGLYLSDMAAVALQSIFPGQVITELVDYESNNTVHVLEPGLVELLGDSISLHMDYPNAKGIQSVFEGVKVLIQGPRKSSLEEPDFPYLVTFPYGAGEVLFTVFHNAHQVDQTEEKLLQYLILRPMMLKEREETESLMRGMNVVLRKEILACVRPGQASPRLGLYLRQGQDLTAVLHWDGNAAFGVQVYDPTGKRVRYFSSDKAPLTFTVVAQSEGRWACSVRDIRADSLTAPFVLGLGG